MNKKQAGIILALLALIVCAGILAAKVNGSMGDVAGDFNIGKNTFNNGDKNTSNKTSDFFYEAKSIREKQSADAIQTLNDLKENKNISQTQRDEIAKQVATLAMTGENERKIETALKGKGFEEAVCSIESGEKARVFVKTKEELTANQRKQIQEVVMSVAKIKNVEIERKQ